MKVFSLSTALLEKTQKLSEPVIRRRFESITFIAASGLTQSPSQKSEPEKLQGNDLLPTTHPSYTEWKAIGDTILDIPKDSFLKRSDCYDKLKYKTDLFLEKYISELPEDFILCIKKTSVNIGLTADFNLSLHLIMSYGAKKKRPF